MASNLRNNQRGGRRNPPPRATNLPARPHANLQPDIRSGTEATDPSHGNPSADQPITQPQRRQLNTFQPRANVDSRLQGPLLPQFYIIRENGARVPLIAVDELPPNIVIEGVNRTLTQRDIESMPGIELSGYMGYRNRVHGVRDIDGRSGPHGIAPGRQRAQEVEGQLINQAEQLRYGDQGLPLVQPLPPSQFPGGASTFSGPEGRGGYMPMNPQANAFVPSRGHIVPTERPNASPASFSPYGPPTDLTAFPVQRFAHPVIDPNTGFPTGPRSFHPIGNPTEPMQATGRLVPIHQTRFSPGDPIPNSQVLPFPGFDPASVSQQPENHAPYWNPAWGPNPYERQT